MIWTLCPINIGPIVQCILNSVHLNLKFTLLLSRFQQNNIHAKLDKLALRNRGVWHKENSGPLGEGGFHPPPGKFFSECLIPILFIHCQFYIYIELKSKRACLYLKISGVGEINESVKESKSKIGKLTPDFFHDPPKLNQSS